MADKAEAAEERDGATTSFAPRPGQSPLRSRRPGMPVRSPLGNSPAPSAPRRRSSIMSLGSESVESFRSTTDDILLPRVSRSGISEETSHLHSAPLFLAVVPAVIGIFFENGGSITTDLTLLALGAILLNWSIRLPWHWYHSAQAVRMHDSISTEDFLPASSDSIIEEENEDGGGSGTEDNGKPHSPASGTSNATPEQLAAASSLRIHEILALITCFLGPIAGAMLLHSIRSQLSRPSEGLVSNYNLTIFLLAAEIRPLSHLIKLVQNRTLHLQRVVATNPHAAGQGSASGGIPNEEIAALASRILALESGSPHGADARSPLDPSSPAGVASKDAAVFEVRRALQPDIDALNRAVRRYEKRATLLSMQIDGRLNTLEMRMQDTLALAAAAERSASGARRGSAATLLDWTAGLIVMPVQAAMWMLAKAAEAPSRALRWVLDATKEVGRATLPEQLVRRFEGKRQADLRQRSRPKEKARVVKKAA